MSEEDQNTPEDLWKKWTLFIRRPDFAEDSPFTHSHDYHDSEDTKTALNKWRYWRVGTPAFPSDRELSNDGIRLDILLHADSAQQESYLKDRGLIKLFCAAHKHGVYPPPAVMNELYERFINYMKDNSSGMDRRLGEYFGEPPEGTPVPSFRREKLESMMDNSAVLVHQLHHWCKCSRKDALSIVSAKLEQVIEEGPWGGLKRQKGYSALEKHYGHWRKETLPIIEENAKKRGKEPWAQPPNDELIRILEYIGYDALSGHPTLQMLISR